jgi:hypothetical protein
MEVKWLRASLVRCFGCGRAFEPPPHVEGAPFAWKPDLAPPPPSSPRRAVGLRLPIAIALVGAGIVAGAVTARALVLREGTLQTDRLSDDK